MFGITLLAFLAGGLFGMTGMAMFCYHSRTNAYREHHTLLQRLDFLENEAKIKRFTPVKSPKTNVHKLVN